MMAIIPSLQDDGKPHVFPPAADGGPVILDDYRCGQHRDKMVIMHNKQPRFNKQVNKLKTPCYLNCYSIPRYTDEEYQIQSLTSLLSNLEKKLLN